MPTFEQGLFAVLFVLPGYVMLKVASVTIAADFGRSAVELLLRCLMLSSVNYAFASPLLAWASRMRWLDYPAGLLGVGIVTLLLLPTALAALYVFLVLKMGLVRAMVEWIGLPYNYPDPSAWDAAFRGIGERAQFVRVTLKSGHQLAGFFGRGSYAGNYPGPRDIFIELAYHIDAQGNPVRPIPGSAGVYVSQDEIAVVEFLRGERPNDEGARPGS